LVKLGGQVEVEHFENCLAVMQIGHQNFYSDLLIIFEQVIEAPDCKGSDRYEAQKLSENLGKFETILNEKR